MTPASCPVDGHAISFGPFRLLANQRLLFEGDRPACRLHFDDWSAQAGTALSPTAGYGLPVNAIEFSRYRADPPGLRRPRVPITRMTVGKP